MPKKIRLRAHMYYNMYSTVQAYCTVQYSTVQYSTVQYSTVQYSTGVLTVSIAALYKKKIKQS
jgi:hypothetical protein